MNVDPRDAPHVRKRRAVDSDGLGFLTAAPAPIYSHCVVHRLGRRVVVASAENLDVDGRKTFEAKWRHKRRNVRGSSVEFYHVPFDAKQLEEMLSQDVKVSKKE